MALSNAQLDAAVVLAPRPEVAPVIQPTPPPVYIAPVSVPLYPAPAVAPTPLNQIRGEGGTPFGFRPELYVQPLVPVLAVPVELRDYRLRVGYEPPPNDAYNPGAVVPTPPETPPRPGDSTIQPVPVGQDPRKAAVPSAV